MRVCEVPTNKYVVFKDEDSVHHFLDELFLSFFKRLEERVKRKLKEYVEDVDEVLDLALIQYTEFVLYNERVGVHSGFLYVPINKPFRVKRFSVVLKKALSDVLGNEKANKVWKEIETYVTNVEKEVYPTKKEVIETARKEEGYLGIVEIRCKRGYWTFKVLENNGFLKYFCDVVFSDSTS